MQRHRENVLDKNVRKGHPVGKKERGKREEGEQKTGFELRFMENRSSSQGYLGKGQQPRKRTSASRRWMGKTSRLVRSLLRWGKDEAEPTGQCAPPWWMPHRCQDGPRTQSLFVPALPDGMTLCKALNLPNECFYFLPPWQVQYGFRIVIRLGWKIV